MAVVIERKNVRRIKINNQPSSSSAPQGSTQKFLTPMQRRRGEALLHHQCWFWGKDILHKEGNALERYGFEKHRPPEGIKGASSYLLVPEEDCQFILWGYGMFYGAKRGVFLNRYNFLPKLSLVSKLTLPIWKKEQLPTLLIPQSCEERREALRLTQKALREIIAYEDWAQKTLGEKWRKKCLKQWENTTLSIQEVWNGWRELSDECEKLLKVD